MRLKLVFLVLLQNYKLFYRFIFLFPITEDDYPEATTAAYSDLAESLEAEALDSPPEVSPDVMKSIADSLVDVTDEEVSAVTENSDAETTTFDQVHMKKSFLNLVNPD